MTDEDEVQSLESDLDRVEEAVERKDFRDVGRTFEERLRSFRSITHEQRSEFWGRYQELWTRRKAFLADRDARSRATKERYLSTLLGLDYKYDGLPIFQNFKNFERVGEKIRACRARIQQMQSEFKADSSLLPRDRDEVRDKIQAVWYSIGQSEETVFIVHGERADDIVNDAARAVDNLPAREAGPLLKAARAEFGLLWLEKGKRDRLHALFEELWSKLQVHREEGKRRHAEWLTRQQEGLERLRAAREKTMESIHRIKANLDANEERLSAARGDEYAARVSTWIEEDRQKIRDREDSIEELERKIRDAEERLKND